MDKFIMPMLVIIAVILILMTAYKVGTNDTERWNELQKLEAKCESYGGYLKRLSVINKKYRCFLSNETEVLL